MNALATHTRTPHAGDVVIRREAPTRYVIATLDRAPQVVCRTFDEALRRAASVASHEHVRVWFRTDDGTFTAMPPDDASAGS